MTRDNRMLRILGGERRKAKSECVLRSRKAALYQ